MKRCNLNYYSFDNSCISEHTYHHLPVGKKEFHTNKYKEGVQFYAAKKIMIMIWNYLSSATYDSIQLDLYSVIQRRETHTLKMKNEWKKNVIKSKILCLNIDKFTQLPLTCIHIFMETGARTTFPPKKNVIYPKNIAGSKILRHL